MISIPDPEHDMISIPDPEQIQEGEIIEGYPENAKGPSCLMLGKGVDDRPIHIVCSPKDEYLAIITAYLPSEQEWSEDFRVRKKP